MGRETDACFDRNAARALGTGIAELVPLNEEIVVEMDMLVGPLLERNGGYGYDTFTVADGLRSSFRYLRLDAACPRLRDANRIRAVGRGGPAWRRAYGRDRAAELGRHFRLSRALRISGRPRSRAVLAASNGIGN